MIDFLCGFLSCTFLLIVIAAKGRRRLSAEARNLVSLRAEINRLAIDHPTQALLPDRPLRKTAFDIAFTKEAKNMFVFGQRPVVGTLAIKVDDCYMHPQGHAVARFHVQWVEDKTHKVLCDIGDLCIPVGENVFVASLERSLSVTVS